MKRGKITKRDSKLIAIWVPDAMVEAIDRAVRQEDSDRSKFIRNAIRNHAKQAGVLIVEQGSL